MATAYGPELAADAATVVPGHSPDHLTTADQGISLYTTNDATLPPPNPPFIFPARLDSTSSAPPSFSRATGRRPMSAIEPSDRSSDLAPGNSDGFRRPVGLPSFSFNPGATLPPEPSEPLLLSPPTSPYSPNTPPSPVRPVGHGHRRGGSEFVGGRIREGNSIAVMSTSPTRSESGFASPTFQPPKRGHRRGVSSTISTSDLPSLHPPFDYSFLKGSSAPTSPTNFERTMEILSIEPELEIPPEPTKAMQEPAGGETPVDTPHAGDRPKDQLRSTKARVGFSDTLEFIPRPVSMVSSDTSSVATARPGHSVSGSISSIVSAASPSEKGSPAPLSRSPTKDRGDSRPSTAGAILERTQDLEPTNRSDTSPRRRNSIPALLDVTDAPVSPASPSPSRSSKRWSFFGLDSFTGSSSPTKARPSSSSSSESTPRAVSAGSSSEHGSESAAEGLEDAEKTKPSKKNKKKKKSKGWAGSILPRKSKSSKRSGAAAVRPPTPPAPTLPAEEEDDVETSEVPPPEVSTPTVTTPTVTITESTSPPRTVDTPKRSEDSSYPMIDLDAALGPFNTPLPHNPEWEAAQRAAGNVGKRRLHSAQGMKGFSGPGMHYHRRAESAPDLPPFDAGRASLHRFGSSSTMADVFEEDEDEEHASTNSKAASVSGMIDLDDVSDGDITPPAAPQRDLLADSLERGPVISRKSSGLSERDQASTHSIRAERSRTSLQDDVIVEEPPSIFSRNPNPFHGSTGSADSAIQSNMKQDPSPVDASLCNPGAIPISPYSMSHASSYPSPRSPISIDAQRISTAPSSVADETNFQSLLMGEPGPEVRISVDYDIPSLTSSNSTMTRDSTYLPNLRMPRPTMREQRPASVSSAFGRRRSSLASLSRLISSSHGERSKLSMEVTMNDEAEKKKAKTSRTKRLSKMMQFWKTGKQGTSS